MLPLMSRHQVPSVMRWNWSSATAACLLGRCLGTNIMLIFALIEEKLDLLNRCSSALPPFALVTLIRSHRQSTGSI